MTVLSAATAASVRRRRAVVWIAIGIAALVVGIAAAAIAQAQQWTQRDALDPDSAGLTGTRAIANVLRTEGIEVIVARDRDSARTALEAGPATLVLPDAPALSDEAIDELARPAAQVVLIEPRSRTLRLLLPGATLAGYDDALTDAACDFGPAARAGAITGGQLFDADSPVDGCFAVGDAGFGLVASDDGERRVVALDGTVLTNERLASSGNAALAVNLLGTHPTVVWYMPSLADTDLSDTNPTLGQLTPPWVTPVIVLLLLSGIAAAVWRGRRFGPLVAERLPVTVRVGETTEGRARLYARAADPAHAAELLRHAARDRLCALLALGRTASVEEIADAASARTGLARTDAHELLYAWRPQTDADLVLLHTRLRDLEDAVRTSIRIERNPR